MAQFGQVRPLYEYAPIGLSADSVILGNERAREKSPCERRPGDRPNPKVLQSIYKWEQGDECCYTDLEGREHFSLLLPIDEIVMVLHRDKWC